MQWFDIYSSYSFNTYVLSTYHGLLIMTIMVTNIFDLYILFL